MSFFENFSDELINKKILPTVIREAAWPSLAAYFSLNGTEGRKGAESGNSQHAIIYRQEGIKAGDGLTYTVPVSGTLDPLNRVSGKEELSGTEGSLSIYEDTVQMHFIRQAVALNNVSLLEASSPVQVENALRLEFSNAFREGLELDTWGALCLQARHGRWTPAGYVPNFVAAGGKPSWHRIYSSIRAVDPLVPNDVAAYNALAGIDAILARGVAAGPARDGHSAIGYPELMALKHMALMGGKTPLAERRIAPTTVFIKKGLPAPNLVFMAEPEVMEKLLADTRIAAMGPNLGKNALEGAPHHIGVTGSFRGTVSGIHLFENEYLSRFRLEGDNGESIAQSFMMGASAIGQGFMSQPEIIHETSDYENKKKWGMKYIRGQKCLMSPSKSVPNQMVEHGVITYLSCVN